MPTHLLLGSLAPLSSKAERLRWASCFTRGFSSFRSDIEAVEDRLEQGVADAHALALGQLGALVVKGGAAALGELLHTRVLFLRHEHLGFPVRLERLDLL